VFELKHFDPSVNQNTRAPANYEAAHPKRKRGVLADNDTRGRSGGMLRIDLLRRIDPLIEADNKPSHACCLWYLLVGLASKEYIVWIKNKVPVEYVWCVLALPFLIW
jgi:hypothetical protein